MRFVPVLFGALTILVCGCGSKPCRTVSQTSDAPTAQAAKVAASTPLILEKDEGERRVVRGWPASGSGRNRRDVRDLKISLPTLRYAQDGLLSCGGLGRRDRKGWGTRPICLSSRVARLLFDYRLSLASKNVRFL